MKKTPWTGPHISDNPPPIKPPSPSPSPPPHPPPPFHWLWNEKQFKHWTYIYECMIKIFPWWRLECIKKQNMRLFFVELGVNAKNFVLRELSELLVTSCIIKKTNYISWWSMYKKRKKIENRLKLLIELWYVSVFKILQKKRCFPNNKMPNRHPFLLEVVMVMALWLMYR